MVANKIGLEVSQRCGAVSQSEIRAMSVECEKHGGINLAQGVCDVPLPDPVRRGAQKAIDDGCNTYTRHDGF
jgi:aminotransferase